LSNTNPLNTGVNTCFPEGEAVPITLVTSNGGKGAIFVTWNNWISKYSNSNLNKNILHSKIFMKITD